MTAIAWRPIPLVPVCLLLAVAAGCSGPEVNKAGGSSEKTVTLTLADHDYGGLDIDPWVREVERASGGTVQIDVQDRWRAKERDYDRGTIGDVRRGRFDIAKIAARSWDEVGVTGFRALVAPLLIDSYGLEGRVLASDLPAQMLPAVEKLDIVGLAVLPGLLRKPLGVSRILRSPGDYKGATIGIRAGGVARMTFAALGSNTVVYVPGERAEVSRLDGAEVDEDVINAAGYNRGARALTGNVNLWPRMLTLVMNRRAFDALSERQKEALRSAAAAVNGPVIKDLADLEREKTKVLCRRGLKFVSAKPVDLAALAKAVRPVYAQLERDAATRKFIAEIKAMKQHASTGRGGAVVCGTQKSGIRTGVSPIDGVYRSTVTRAELLRNPTYVSGEDNLSNYGAFTLTIANGHFKWTGAGDGVPEGGTFTLESHQRVTIRPTYPSEEAGKEFVYVWNTYRGVLSLSKPKGEPAEPTFLVVHAWRPA